MHILVPLDGSARAEEAIIVATRIAKATHGSLTFLRIVPPVPNYGYPGKGFVTPALFGQEIMAREVSQAEKYLSDIAAQATLAGIQVTTKVTVDGVTAKSILSQSTSCDLIVLCSHGYTGLKRWALGSIAEKMVRHSRIPLLVLHESGESSTHVYATEPHPMHVLVGLDGSSLAESVLEPVAQLCMALSQPEMGSLHLTQVLTLPAIGMFQRHTGAMEARERIIEDTTTYLKQAEQLIGTRENLITNSSVIVHDDVAKTLVDRAEHGEYLAEAVDFAAMDMIALTTHGRGGLQRWALGSIAERVLAETKLPVFIIHASAD